MQRRHALAPDDLSVRRQLADHRPHRVGAEQHRLGVAARIEDAVGEDVAAIEIACDLDFVDGQKLDHAIERHRFHRADEIAGALGGDLFFAGDQRHGGFAFGRHRPVIHLARQQPQRQTDHAAAVAQHALDGEVGFAGVGWSQDGFDPGAVGHGRMVGLGLGEFKPARSRTSPATDPVENWSREGNKNESLPNQSI